MRHSRNRTLCLLLALLAAATGLHASPILRDLNIYVVLSRNGDARITETRQMYIDSQGTECYIGLANMGGSTVCDLTVTDETGREYENVGEWDIDRSREWKAGKCGIVTTSRGYEVCWGLGDSGERTYVTTYTLTGLVRSYPDADAIRHVFLDHNVSPKPQHAVVTITSADSLSFNEDSCGIWGFRYRGFINFVDGDIVAETSESMSHESSSALYIMVRFDKGMFEPTLAENTTFEQKKQEAFEGSDYTDSGEEFTAEDIFYMILSVLGFIVFPLVAFIYRIVSVWRFRRRVNKDLLWYRDIPLKGNLQKANDMLNAYRYLGSNYDNLLSAYVLQLINIGGIAIEQRMDQKGNPKQFFVIKELEQKGLQPRLVRMVHNIFKEAAGDDTILEPRELRQWMNSRANRSYVESFVVALQTRADVSNYKSKEKLAEVQQVFGLKKFLKDFTLLDERHVSEVSLWKDYMVYATLFGIADQVIKDMKKVNPEYFNLDQVAQQMADNMTLPMISTALRTSTQRAAQAKAAREARASGRGGGSSWGGGGGGFSGGGGGGGVR